MKILSNRSVRLALKKVLSKLYILETINSIRKKKYNKKISECYKLTKKTGELPLPVSMVYEPTAKCNLNCKMCFFNKELTYKTKDMPLPDLKNSFGKFSKNIKRVVLTGGECFVRPDIFKILDFFKKEGIMMHLTTNGTLINEENINKIKNNKNITHVGISIDGLGSLHNTIRRSTDAFGKAVNAIKILKQNKIPVNIVCVILKDNLDQLTEVVKLGHRLGVDAVFFELERIYDESDIKEVQDVLRIKREDIPLTPQNCNRGYPLEKLNRVLNGVERLGKELKVEVHYYPNFLRTKLEGCYYRKNREPGKKYFCMALFDARIDPAGNVVPCFAIREKIGNIKKNELKDIWNSEEFKDYRKTLLNNNLLKICETCLYMCEVK